MKKGKSCAAALWLTLQESPPEVSQQETMCVYMWIYTPATYVCVYVSHITVPFHVCLASVNYESKGYMPESVPVPVVPPLFTLPPFYLPPNTHIYAHTHKLPCRGPQHLSTHSHGSLMTAIPLCATLLISSMILADGTCTAD